MRSAANPKLLLADELSLGLAPMIVDRLLGAVRKAADELGIGALIVEQHARKALKYSDRMYLMARGQIRMEMPLGRGDAHDSTRSKRPTSPAPSETEEDHIERKRRKDKRKAWGRQRVRERELRRLTGTQVSRRRTRRRRRLSSTLNNNGATGSNASAAVASSEPQGD